jgi:TonB family protein
VKAPPVEVPRIAPPKAADAPDPATPPKPQLALLLVPLPASPATDAARPALAMPRLAAEPVPPAPPSPPTPPAVTTATDAVPVLPASSAPAQPSPTTGPPGDGRRPGPNVPAADPAQQSDSETDPFSKIGSVEFRDGRLDVQFGRKVKVTRPRVPIVGQIDAMTLRQPRVVLKVTTDVTGKVTSVAIHKSSGSNEIDQPCLIAMYDWWFEPAKDKAGRPLADTFLFTISFR